MAASTIKPLGITQQYVRELFDLRGGELFWKVKRKAAKPGDLAGSPFDTGYWRVKIDGRTFRRSRLIWLYVHGVDTYPLQLDHKNRIRSDDRVENLHPVTDGENQRNRAWGKSKHRYVYLESHGRWRARVSADGKSRVTIGNYDTEAEAIAAVQQWESACA